jgi:hypothetical protein
VSGCGEFISCQRKSPRPDSPSLCVFFAIRVPRAVGLTAD